MVDLSKRFTIPDKVIAVFGVVFISAFAIGVGMAIYGSNHNLILAIVETAGILLGLFLLFAGCLGAP